MGPYHSYPAAGGLVAGYDNTVSGDHASVTGGRINTASYTYAAVSGGHANIASGYTSTASGLYVTASGGAYNNVALPAGHAP